MGDITVQIEIPADRSFVVIRFMDSGVPYNPLDTKEPNLTLSAKERPKVFPVAEVVSYI